MNTTSSLPEPTHVAADIAILKRVQDAGAEYFNVPPDDVTVASPRALAPSSCRVLTASVVMGAHTEMEWFVEMDDGALIKGGSDERLAEVANRCFVDQDILPDSEAAGLLALKIGQRRQFFLLGDIAGRRALEPFGIEWTPPTATATNDGFVITSFVGHTNRPSVFRVTTTVTADSATSEYEELTS